MIMRRILIVGATSAIAQATARRLAERGVALCLMARDRQRLEIMREDLITRGARQVEILVLDINRIEEQAATLEQAYAALPGGLDAALIAVGELPDQARCEREPNLMAEVFQINLVGVACLLGHLANYFGARGRGCLAAIGSVAGDRGRGSNYLYGSAKGGLDLLLAGLRHRLYRRGVTVLTIKPGFVDTPMTAHLPKNFLYASPERVAADIEAALLNNRREIYTPWFWRWIMLIIRLLPQWLFLRTKL